MRTASNERMALIARELASVAGVDVDLMPGGFPAAEMQLLVTCTNGALLSVMPDLDVALLYEVIHFAQDDPLLYDKLTLEGAVAAVKRIAAGQTPEGVSPGSAAAT